MDTKDFTAVLKVLNACDESIRWVDNRPLATVWDICPNNDWKEWLLRAVKHPAWKAYLDAMANAWKVYRDVEVPAWETYDDVVATTRKAREDAEANAWKVYRDAIAPARKAYDNAVADAQKALLAVDVQSVQDVIDDFFKK